MNNILSIILESHRDDREQQEVITTDKNRLVIEAPAGYGKTKTMISQIAYLIASHKLPNPKKILALTFSVNAAYKVRKDISSSAFERLPPHFLKDKVVATNYHGFCRRVLSLYGYSIDEKLKNIENFISIDDSDIEILNRNQGLDLETAKFLSDFNDAVKKINIECIKDKFFNYNNTVKKNLLNTNFITFNSIITLTIELFHSKQNIKDFYQKLYPIIIVDEFQDTNILSLCLLNTLVSDETRLYLYGDSLQRIYGFIGAIPNLLEISQKKFKADKIELKTNYRFKNNQEMLVLDKNIREIAKDISSDPNQKASLKLYLTKNQDEEADIICNLCKSMLERNKNKRIAILVRQRGKNIDRIIEEFKNKRIDFFYALFSDEDKEYVEFHKTALTCFLNLLKNKK
ncbi:MAG: ATP-dependent helicase [Breznakiellaceae bacterium]